MKEKCFICSGECSSGNLCALHEVEHRFKCYQIEVAPILIERYCQQSNALQKEMDKIRDQRDFFVTDSLIKYVGEKGKNTSPDEILEHIKQVRKKHNPQYVI